MDGTGPEIYAIFAEMTGGSGEWKESHGGHCGGKTGYEQVRESARDCRRSARARRAGAAVGPTSPADPVDPTRSACTASL